MRRRTRELPPEDFNMTPMIDMVFLLLVFFMCVSSLSQANLRLPAVLPVSAESKVPTELTDRVTVTVRADGALFWGASAVDEKTLAARVREEVRRDPRVRLNVRAEAATPFALVRRVLRAAAEAGVVDVIYATHQE